MVSTAELNDRYNDMVKKLIETHKKLAKAHSKEAESYQKMADSHRKIAEAHQNFIKTRMKDEEVRKIDEEEGRKIQEFGKDISESKRMESDAYTNLYNMLRLVHPEADADILMVEVAILCNVSYDKVMDNVTELFFSGDMMGGCFNYLQ